MAEHTPTPWKASDDLGCKPIKGGKSAGHRQAQYTEIAWTVGLAEEIDAANAARIVACVNAFHGRDIPTEKITEGLFWEMVGELEAIADETAATWVCDRIRALLAKLEE